MRKLLWSGCLAGAVAAGSMLGSAWYAYKNPDSLLGHCCETGLLVSTRYNPLLNGSAIAVVDLTKVSWTGEDAAAPKDLEDAEEPADPTPLIELPGLLELPLPGVPGPVCEDPEDLSLVAPAKSTLEPPLAIVDPDLQQAGGATVVPAPRPFMPPCEEDEDLPAVGTAKVRECQNGSPLGKCFTTVASFWTGAAKVCDASWLSLWCSSCTSSPTMLEKKCGEEAPELKKLTEPSDCKEDPNRPFQPSGCACPGAAIEFDFSGPGDEPKPWPLPAVEPRPTNDTPRAEPLKVPEIDTMEFRPSDRTWEESGLPFVL